MNNLLLRLACLNEFGFDCSYEWNNQVFTRGYHHGCHIHNIAFDTFYFSVPILFGDISNPVYVLIEECSFYQCINNNVNSAGCILYLASSGYLYLKKTCANHCVCSGDGQFLSCIIKDTVNLYTNVSTVVYCAPPSYCVTDKYSAFYVSEGNIFFSCNNISDCRSYSYTIAKFYSNPNITWNFIHLSHNSPYNYPAMYFQSSFAEFSFLNVIANSAPSGSIFLTNSAFDMFFKNCLFYNNFDILFNGFRKVKLENCIVIHSGKYTTCITTLELINVTTSISTLYTFEISRYSTHRCYDQEYSISEMNGPCQTIPPVPSTCNIHSHEGNTQFNLITSIYSILLI